MSVYINDSCQSPMDAISIIEMEENPNPRAYLEAWQYIGKNGLHRSLQGFYGRNLQEMFNQNILTEDFELTAYAEETLENAGY